MKIAENYKEISDGINDAQARGSDIVSFIDKMNTDISNSEIPSDDIHKKKLEKQVISTSDILNSKNIRYTSVLIIFVEELQRYITTEYGSVDTFLSDNNIRVKSTFAEISEYVGFPINPSLISDVS